jgi:hypothetical protein
VRPRLGTSGFPILAVALVLAIVAPARAEWATNGVRCTSASGDQASPVVASDAVGGVYVAWLDPRSGYNTDVFVQRIGGNGSPVSGWNAGGSALTTVTCMKYDPVIIADSLGAIVAWADDRCRDNSGVNIYAHRMAANGTPDASWPLNGAALCVASGDQTHPANVTDGAGGALVVWDDRRAGVVSLYAMRVLASGTPAPGWPIDGALIASDTGDPAGPAVVSDGAGGAIVTWEHHAAGTADIHAQRITASGTIAAGWPAGGMIVCGLPGDQTSPRIVADGVGGAFVGWIDHRGPSDDIYLERINAAGARVSGWAPDGNAICTASGDQNEVTMTADGLGGVLMAWTDARTPANGMDIYAARVSSSGANVAGWPAGGVAECAAATDQRSPAIAADGAGGAFVSWTDARNAGATALDLESIHMTSTGTLASGWTSNGLPIAAASGDQNGARSIADGHGGAFVAWTDARASATTGVDIFATHVVAQGLEPTQVSGLVATHRNGQTFLTWTAPPGLGWTYHVYRSLQPITSASSLASATLLAQVGDSTWCDHRLYVLTGTAHHLAVDSLAPPLATTQGLFVETPAMSGSAWYAVTAQLASYDEDRAITPGVNALTSPVAEQVATPRPVFQRTLPVGTLNADVYALWVDDHDTPLAPAMANRAGMLFDCAIVRGGTSGGMLIRPHQRQGNFLGVLAGTSTPGEWVLALDDPLPNGENTFWYGYHENYDVTSQANVPPTTGVVRDYTMRRVLLTVLWARRNFPIDTTRVYAYGYSMGGIGSVLLAYRRPDLLAAVISVCGKYDFSFLDDPNPANAFNSGGLIRDVTDRMWGTVATNLPTSEGSPIYSRLNDGVLNGSIEPSWLPPIMAFNGRNDVTVGWAEKISWYQSLRDHRTGGYEFWDLRDHTSPGEAAWTPMEDMRYLYRFRTRRSFPALTHCSADDDPGNGNAASGDSVGMINGYVEWDTTLVDQPTLWETTLRLRYVSTKWGPVPTPDSLRVDVTPRRTIAFRPVAGEWCSWQVLRLNDNALVASGTVRADSLARITIPAVPVSLWGARLDIFRTGGTAVSDDARIPIRLSLALSRNPVSTGAMLAVAWPRAEAARVDLVDVTGRRIACLWQGRATPGAIRIALDTSHLPDGLYFAVARTAEERVSHRVVVVR